MARSRQPNGRPSIYQGADGRWYCWVTIGTSNGKPHRKKLSGLTATAVSTRYDELMDRLRRGSTPTARIETVEQWLLHWLENVVKPARAWKTYAGYRSLITKHVIPRIGGWRLDGTRHRLEPEHLEAMYAQLRDREKLAGTYVLQVHRVLRKSFKDATRRGKASRNVCDLIDPPTARGKKVDAHTLGETQAIIAAAMTDPMADRWLIGILLGPRQGEALGLRWHRLALDPPAPEAPYLNVVKQLQRRSWQHGCSDPEECARPRCRTERCRQTCPDHRGRRGCTPACRTRCTRHTRPCPAPCRPGCVEHARHCPKRYGGGLVEVDVKSAKGERTLPLPPVVVELLRARREQQIRQFDLLGLPWSEEGLVFVTDAGGAIDPKVDHRAWERLLSGAGLPDSRLHAARHTAGTMMVATGTDIRIVQEMLGHAKVTTTQLYVDVADSVKRDALDRAMAAVMEGQLGVLLQPNGATTPAVRAQR